MNRIAWAETLPDSPIRDYLDGDEAAVVAWLIERVLTEVPAELVQATLFGSVARNEATPESDVDVLLIFHQLPPDREPQASHAEAIAEEIAAESGIPVTVWSVSLVDLMEGNRTPMLVDALSDSIPVWLRDRPIPILPFTPRDALRCTAALLRRVEEGSVEFRELVAEGEPWVAARRARDDIVRLCTGWLLLNGITRPRRAEAVARFRQMSVPAGEDLHAEFDEVLAWAIRSFGPTGREEGLPFGFPPGGPPVIRRVIDRLRTMVEARGDLVYHRWNHENDGAEGALVLHP